MTRRHLLFCSVFIAALTTLAYSGSFDGDFVSDDIRGIQQNELLRSLDWPNIERIFTTRFDGSNYIPVTALSFAVDRRVFGPAPFGFHLTNLLLHIVCALLFQYLLLRLGITPAAAFLAALVWAVHPLNVESVAFISERKNVLSTFFFLSAFLVYLDFSESGRWSRYLFVLVLFVLAVLSKMNTVVLPAVCVAYEMTARFRLRLRDVLASLPMFALGATVAWLSVSAGRAWGNAYHGGSAIVTGLSSATVIFRYLRRVVVPTDLSDYYAVRLRDSVLDPVVALSLLGLLVLVAVFVWLAATRRRQAFWMAWFAITLSPMLNIIPFPTLMQDRYMHLPLMGLLALVAEVSVRNLRSTAMRRAFAAVAGTIVLAFAMLTHARVEVWSTPLSLWESRSLRTCYLASDSGRFRPEQRSAQMAILRRALVEDPGNAVLYNNLGALAFETGDLVAARQYLEQAEEREPHDPAILLNLGRTYWRRGDLAKAEGTLERAIDADPYSFFAHLNLARVHLTRGDASAARVELDAAARIRPASAALWSHERAQLERLQGGG